MPKSVIKNLTLREISSVDRPAQVGATFVIAKRAEQPTQEPDMPKTRAELEAAIAKFDKDGGTTADIVGIRKAATDLKLPELIAKHAVLAPPADADALAAVQAQVEKMGKLADLTPAQRAMYDKMDPDAQKLYLLKSGVDLAKALDQDIAKAAGDDPVVHTCLDGTELRKSAGEAVISMAKRMDAAERRAASSEAARLDEDLAKRADDKAEGVGNLAGTVETRKALLRAVAGIGDEAVRKNVTEVLKAANTAAGGAFVEKGSREQPATGGSGDTPVRKSGAAGEAEGKLDDLAKAYAKEHNVPFAKAYGQVMLTQEGADLYAKTLN